MKSLAVITTMLLSAMTAFGGTAAYAAEGDTIYPQDSDFIRPLTFTSLSDFAVDGDCYAFAEGKKVYVYENGNLRQLDSEEKITGLDCAEGVFYWSAADGLYRLGNEPDSEPEIYEEQFEFRSCDVDLIFGNYIYYYDENGALTVHEKSTKLTTTFEGEYSKLKQYGEKVYAVKDNVLYSFEGAGQTEISLEYADYDATQKIAVGQTAANLKNYSLEFVDVEAGAYMTEIDLTSLDGEYFISGQTVNADEDTVALLLCRSGNAAIISVGDTSYVLLESKTKANNSVNCYVEKEFDNATIIGNRIYASPFTVIGTTLLPEATGTIVSVNRKLELNGVLNSVYYEVTYTEADSNAVKTGYVADGFLTKFIIEDNKTPVEVTDPEYTEDNDLVTVLLILAVVVLVLIAIGYLTCVGTRDKKKDKKQEKKAEKKQAE